MKNLKNQRRYEKGGILAIFNSISHEFHVTESPFGRQFLPYSASAFSMTTCKPIDVYIFLKDLAKRNIFRVFAALYTDFWSSTTPLKKCDGIHSR